MSSLSGSFVKSPAGPWATVRQPYWLCTRSPSEKSEERDSTTRPTAPPAMTLPSSKGGI